MKNKLKNNIVKRIEVLSSFDDIFFTTIENTVLLLKDTLKENKILIYGNGGSATQSSHFAAELVNRFYKDRVALNAIALTTDIANITSIANDYNYTSIFSRQVEAIGNKNDVSIGITTSGKSENVIKGLKVSKEKGLKTIALCGNHTKPLKDINTDIIISVNNLDTPIIQEIHIFILHFIAEQLEELIFDDK